MSEYKHSRGTQMLPQVAAATAAVVLVPVALVWWLRAARIVTSSWVCVVLAVALSVAVSALGSALWKRCDGSERVVFSELLLWGWIRRVRQERQLANVVKMLGIDRPDELPDASSRQQHELLGALATALDAQDPYTEGHSRRVARHAAMVAREMRLSDDEVQRIRAAAAVHDVGKLRIPTALLSKPGRLTVDEFEVVKRHATEGAALVAELGDDGLAAIVRHHHERFDGRGYPSGLGGEDIPLGARIVAVADTFDAITSIRPYRPAERHKLALDHLAGIAGTQLDPAAVRAFVRYYSGRKMSTLWAGLAVVPQRLFGWMHGNGGAAGNVVVSEVAATIGGVLAVGLAAMGTAAAVGVGRAAFRERSPTVFAQRGPAAATGGGPVAGASAPAAGGTAVAGATTRRVAGRRNGVTYIAVNTPRAALLSHGVVSRPGKGASGNGSGTGTVQAGGSPGGSAHTSQPVAPGARPHRVVKLGGSGSSPGPVPSAGLVPGAGPTPSTGPAPSAGPAPSDGPSAGPGPTHAGGSGPAPAGNSQPVVIAPVVSNPGSSGASSGSVNAGPATPPGSPGTSPGSPGSGVAGAPGGTSNPPPSGPTDKDQCKQGGYEQWGFKNQGQCIASAPH